MTMQTTSDNAQGEPIMDINTTPLIDVLLVLLIMFIITIPIQTHAVKLDLPQSNQPPPPQDVMPEVVNLEIDFDGTVIWNGTPVTTRGQLDRFLQDTAAKVPQPEVHLRPNRLAKYDAVARTLADAQRLGVTKIGFVGNEQYVE